VFKRCPYPKVIILDSGLIVKMSHFRCIIIKRTVRILKILSEKSKFFRKKSNNAILSLKQKKGEKKSYSSIAISIFDKKESRENERIRNKINSNCFIH